MWQEETSQHFVRKAFQSMFIDIWSSTVLVTGILDFSIHLSRAEKINEHKRGKISNFIESRF